MSLARMCALMAAIGCAALVAAGLTPAKGARRPTTFQGSCRLSGDIAFHQPIGNSPRTVSFSDTGRGTCTGRLNGVAVRDMAVLNRVKGSGTLGCGAGSAHTVDTLVFARRHRLRILTDSAFAGTEAVAHTRGAVSGHSVERVTFSVDEATLAACHAGTLRSAHYELRARTLTPLAG